MNLDEFIKELIELQKQGHGSKSVIYDQMYTIKKVEYDEDNDSILVY